MSDFNAPKVTTFSCGHLEYPKDTDDHFDTLEEAEESAIDGSIDDSAWDVWEDETGDLCSIAYGRQLFYS